MDTSAVHSHSVATADDGSLKRTTEQAGFLSLPAELRNAIYELALRSRRKLFILGACRHGIENSATQPALTRVNRQIRAESLPIFYSINVFTTHLHRCDFGYFFDFMNCIGEKNRSYMRNMTMHLKDRWTCGRGLLDFLRWCVKTEGVGSLAVGPDITTWNREHGYHAANGRKLSPALRRYDMSSMGPTVKAFQGVIELSEKLEREGRTSELHLRKAFDEFLTASSFNCGPCWIYGPTGPQNNINSPGGICTAMHRVVDEKSNLGPKCDRR